MKIALHAREKKEQTNCTTKQRERKIPQSMVCTLVWESAHCLCSCFSLTLSDFGSDLTALKVAVYVQLA